MPRPLAALLACALIVSACEAGRITPGVDASAAPVTAAAPSAAPARSPSASPPVAASPSPVETFPPCAPGVRCPEVADALSKIDPAKLNDHLLALTAVGSRDPRHPGHAKAVAYIKEQLGALSYYGWRVESHLTTYQGIRLENIFASLDGASAGWSGSIRQRLPPATSWVMIAAHYDSTANRTPGWRPSVDPAPGADDNATGTAALLEFARVVSVTVREHLRSRLVLAFFDGEEFFYKGSAAYLQTLAKPYPITAVVDIDMVGFNPIADRLDLIYYTQGSAALRDRIIAANATYSVGVSPLLPQLATDGNTILDAAPFGLAGIPSVALVQRYGEKDATFPGNYTFHTTGDTPDKIMNTRLWLKAAKLTLAVALELVMTDRGG